MAGTRSLGALLGIIALLLGSLGPAALLLHADVHADHPELAVLLHGHEHPASTPDHDHPTGERPAVVSAGVSALHFVIHATLVAMPPLQPLASRVAVDDAFLSASPPFTRPPVLRI